MAYWHKRINDFSTSSDIALLIRSVTPLAYIISHSEPLLDSISFEAVVMFSLPFGLFILTGTNPCASGRAGTASFLRQ